MEQTHLIFVRLPDKKIIALRHEWLFGQSVLKRLKSFIKFLQTVPPLLYYQLISSTESFTFFLAYAYSDFGDKRLFSISENPKETVSNNGITIIDLSEFQLIIPNTERKIKYCFMSTSHLDCHESKAFLYSEGGKSCLRPLSAETYLSAYYPEGCEAMGKREDKDLISFFKGIPVLTLPEVKKIFPKLKKE